MYRILSAMIHDRGMLRTGVVVVACATVLRRLQKLSITWAKRKANHGRAVLSPDETGAHAFVLKSSKGVQLYCRRWGSPDNPTAAFIFVHGELLSGSAFQKLAEKLTPRGYVCYAIDLTGFGKSGWQQGVQSHIAHSSDYLDDLSTIVDFAKLNTGNAPVILYGEGLGATCCLAFDLIEANKNKVATIIATSARLKPTITVDRVEHGFYGLLGRLIPTLPGPREQTARNITDLFADPEIGMEAEINFEKYCLEMSSPAVLNFSLWNLVCNRHLSRRSKR